VVAVLHSKTSNQGIEKRTTHVASFYLCSTVLVTDFANIGNVMGIDRHIDDFAVTENNIATFYVDG
jgi:hypothetical protein